MAYSSKPPLDFYGVLGWLSGLLIISFYFPSANHLSCEQCLPFRRVTRCLPTGLAVAWWLNPLFVGEHWDAWGNRHIWRAWTALGLFIWFGVNVLVTLAFVSEDARTRIFNGLILLGYILLGLLFLYIQLRVFIWAASGKPTRFFFGIMGWAALNGLIYWAFVNPGGVEHYPGGTWFALRVFCFHSLAIIQFVAIFWFMAHRGWRLSAR